MTNDQTDVETVTAEQPIWTGHLIGDVMSVSDSIEIPESWHPLDGSVLQSSQWPEFTKAMKIGEASFTLPTPGRVVDGITWIIHLGANVPAVKVSPQLRSLLTGETS